MGITFSHPNASIGAFNLRLAPTQVDWDYKINTSVTNTYGGQVVQILSINFGNLEIMGQFGKEGPRGATRGPRDSNGKQKIYRRSQMNNNMDGIRDYSGSAGLYSNGLTQMTEYFTKYFNLATQGTSSSNYDQRPMKIVYSGALDVSTGVGDGVEEWLAYPVNFPSYNRSNANFAPKWKVSFMVYEAPAALQTRQMDEEWKRIREGVGYRPFSEFSDPLGEGLLEARKDGASLEKILKMAQDQVINDALDTSLDEEATLFAKQLPAYDPGALEQLFSIGASAPTKAGGKSGG